MSPYSLRTKQSGITHLILLAAVVLVVIGGIGAYVVTGGFKGNSGTNSHNSFKASTATTPTALKAMFAAAKSGAYDVKCTLNYDKAAASKNALLSVTGPATLYISGASKMRIDMTISGKPGHFMRLGDSVYLWTDGNTNGSKFPVVNSSKTSTSSKLSTESFANNAKDYDLKCQSVASLDASLFVLPSSVHFVDINSTLQSQSSGGQ